MEPNLPSLKKRSHSARPEQLFYWPEQNQEIHHLPLAFFFLPNNLRSITKCMLSWDVCSCLYTDIIYVFHKKESQNKIYNMLPWPYRHQARWWHKFKSISESLRLCHFLPLVDKLVRPTNLTETPVFELSSLVWSAPEFVWAFTLLQMNWETD